MGYLIEGEVLIPLEEFWEFVHKYLPEGPGEIAFGMPKVNIMNIVIPFASGTEGHPSQWSEKPEFLNEWKSLK